MLAIEIQLLTGRYVATAHDDRARAEWPPHPARVFSALVATWGAEDVPDSAERLALEWLEQLPAPVIECSPATERTPVTHYVPVADASVIGLSETSRRYDKITALLAKRDDLLEAGASDTKIAAVESKIAAQRDVESTVSSAGSTAPGSAVEMLARGRGRQARTWPGVRPIDPIVELRWPDVDPSDEMLWVLDGLCGRLVRIGHSTSLVAVRCHRLAGSDRPHWTPDDKGTTTLRWVRRGQLAALEAAHRDHQASAPRTLPSSPVRYRAPHDLDVAHQPAGAGFGGPWRVLAFRPGQRRLPSIRAVQIASTLRLALISHAIEPVDPAISGHAADRRPTTAPHMAIVPLPMVGHEHATGELMGVAIVSPDALSAESESAIDEALQRFGDDGSELRMGRNGTIVLDGDATALQTLARSTWSGPSTDWVSVTPIALPHHPGDLASKNFAAADRAARRAERAVRASCEHVGLPEPAHVSVGLAPVLRGTERARAHPAFRQGDLARALVHARVVFDEPVAGPMVLGSGRFLGLGLMWPAVGGS